MNIRRIAATGAAVLAGAAMLVLPTVAVDAGTGTTTSTTSTTVDPATCPGGPECYGFSISPTSGPAGTPIDVRAVLGACTAGGLTAAMWDNVQPSPGIGAPILVSTELSPGAGNAGGVLTVPPGTPPGDYPVGMLDDSSGRCQATFTVTGTAPVETTTTTTPAAVLAQPAYTG